MMELLEKVERDHCVALAEIFEQLASIFQPCDFSCAPSILQSNLTGANFHTGDGIVLRVNQLLFCMPQQKLYQSEPGTWNPAGLSAILKEVGIKS